MIVKINWDTDGENPDALGLPESVDVPDEIAEEDISDWLSDEYGFCVDSLEY